MKVCDCVGSEKFSELKKEMLVCLFVCLFFKGGKYCQQNSEGSQLIDVLQASETS